MGKMRWEDLPKGTPMSLSKENVEKLKGNSTGAFVTGMVCGAIGLAVLQGCQVEKADAPTGNVKPSPTASSSNN